MFRRSERERERERRWWFCQQDPNRNSDWWPLA
jgi:hypothetical protein